MKNLIGVDLGGTKCADLLGNISKTGDLSVVDKIVYSITNYPTPDIMLPQLLSGIIDLTVKNKVSIEKINSMGISCGGPLDTPAPARLHSLISNTRNTFPRIWKFNPVSGKVAIF